MLNLSCERVKCSFRLLCWACRELDYWWNQQADSPNKKQMELANFTKDDIPCCFCCHKNVHAWHSFHLNFQFLSSKLLTSK
jgi:hypothetical protein